MVSMFYGTGLRMNELRLLEPFHIESKNFQIKVVHGKGGRERFSILPKSLLEPLRKYYKKFRLKNIYLKGRKRGVQCPPDFLDS